MTLIPIQIRRGTGSSATSNNPILLDGELGWDKTALRFKMGDGTTDWNALPYIDKPLQDSIIAEAALRAAADATLQTNLNSEASTRASADTTLQTNITNEAIARAAADALKADLVAGKVPSSQLPSYVDDVVEVANFAALPVTGETGKIYITINNNNQYRWSGSAYTQITSSPGSTDAVPEGVTNLYYTNARVLNAVLTGLSVAVSGDIVSTDTLIGALGKLQNQLNNIPYVPIKIPQPIIKISRFDMGLGYNRIRMSTLPNQDYRYLDNSPQLWFFRLRRKKTRRQYDPQLLGNETRAVSSKWVHPTDYKRGGKMRTGPLFNYAYFGESEREHQTEWALSTFIGDRDYAGQNISFNPIKYFSNNGSELLYADFPVPVTQIRAGSRGGGRKKMARTILGYFCIVIKDPTDPDPLVNGYKLFGPPSEIISMSPLVVSGGSCIGIKLSGYQMPIRRKTLP